MGCRVAVQPASPSHCGVDSENPDEVVSSGHVEMESSLPSPPSSLTHVAILPSLYPEEHPRAQDAHGASNMIDRTQPATKTMKQSMCRQVC